MTAHDSFASCRSSTWWLPQYRALTKQGESVILRKKRLLKAELLEHDSRRAECRGSKTRSSSLASTALAYRWATWTATNDLDAIVGQLRLSNTVNEWNEVWINRLLTAGDANRDGQFDQLDIVEVLQGGKYNTGRRAAWSTGDWNLDGVFDQLDIGAAPD